MLENLLGIITGLEASSSKKHGRSTTVSNDRWSPSLARTPLPRGRPFEDRLKLCVSRCFSKTLQSSLPKMEPNLIPWWRPVFNHSPSPASAHGQCQGRIRPSNSWSPEKSPGQILDIVHGKQISMVSGWCTNNGNIHYHIILHIMIYLWLQLPRFFCELFQSFL